MCYNRESLVREKKKEVIRNMDMYQKRKMRQAEKVKNAEENKTQNVAINWFPGHMAKTKKQIIEDLKLIDVVVEVLDARIPVSSRNRDLEQYLTNKKRVIVLNKADLADTNITKMWQDKFNSQGIIAVPMEAANKKGTQDVINAIKEQAKEIVQKYAEKGRIGRSIKVMVLGIPNVGKSTFINSLSKKNVVKVENRPGVTRQKQWIKINEQIELMDTPGMLWPKLDNETVQRNLAFTKSIGQNALDNEEIAYFLLEYLLENYTKRILERYNLELDEIEGLPTYEVMEIIARKKGALLPGAKVDTMKVSNIILNDFQSGKLGKISLERP